ncbi:MAG: hypothetical protein NTY19_43925 [Planctomycetota bacterium]|nr:hypothetical protein [Planctomycetota bacterium]
MIRTSSPRPLAGPMAAAPADLHRGGLLMRWMTPSVEKDIESLSAPLRPKVCRALSVPIEQGRCEKLKGHPRYGLSHFRITRSIRVTFRLVDGGACVLHVGTHSDFDCFAEHHKGIVPNRLVPIKESTVMTKYTPQNDKTPVNGKGVVNGNGVGNRKSAVGDPVDSKTDTAVDAEAAGMLMQAIVSIVHKAHENEARRLDDDILGAVVLAESQKERLNDQENATKTLQDNLVSRGLELRDRLNNQDKVISEVVERLQAGIGAIRCDMEASAKQRPHEAELAACTERLNRMEEATTMTESAVSALAAKIDVALEMAAGLDRRLTRVTEAIDRLVAEREECSLTARLARVFRSIQQVVERFRIPRIAQ